MEKATGIGLNQSSPRTNIELIMNREGAFAFLVLLFLVLAGNEGRSEIIVEALVDAKAELRVADDGIYWRSLSGAKPGKHGGRDEPTIINGTRWHPKWESDNERGKETSQKFPIATSPETLTISLMGTGSRQGQYNANTKFKVQCRHENGELVGFVFDNAGGSRWYQFRIYEGKPTSGNTPTPGGGSETNSPETARMILLSGNASAASIDLAQVQTSTNGLLVMPLGGSAYAGSASKMTGIALPAAMAEPATVAFSQPVGETMETALSEVLKFVELRHNGWPRGKEIEISFEEKYSPKDGPSAALACALLLDSLVTGNQLDADVALTGDMNVDGSVQPVGGVAAKIRGGSKAGCGIVGIPSRNLDAVRDLLVREGIRPFVETQVFSLETFHDGLAIASLKKPLQIDVAIEEFKKVQEVFNRPGASESSLLKNPKVQEKLKLVLETTPNHLSAKALLIAASGKPAQLSIGGSVETIDQASYELVNGIASGGQSRYSSLGQDVIADALSELRQARSMLDQRAWSYADAVSELGQELREFLQSPPKSQTVIDQAISEIDSLARAVDYEREALLSIPSVVESLIN